MFSKPRNPRNSSNDVYFKLYQAQREDMFTRPSQQTPTPECMASVHGAYPMSYRALPIDVCMRPPPGLPGITAPPPRLKNSIDSGCSTASQG